MLQRYEAYKESGVDWLGEIPDVWELVRIASVFQERKEKVSDKDFKPLSVTKNGILPQLKNAAKTNDGDNRKLVKKGDFVINSRSDRKGSSGIAQQDGSVSLINIVMETKEIDPSFCNQILKSYAFIEEYYRIGHGIVADLWTTRYSEMKTVLLPLPPLLEQTAIANFLDDKTAKIDELVGIKRRQIALLRERKQILIQNAVTKGLNPDAPMKESGIDWIGEIPAHWQVFQLKRLVVFLQTGPFGTELHAHDYVSNGIPLINPKHMKGGRLLPEIDCSVDEQAAARLSKYQLKTGDLIMARRGELGRCAAISEKENGWLCGTGSLIVRLEAGNFNILYFFRLISGEGISEMLRLESIGSTMDNLNTTILGKLLLPFPSLKEQNEIIISLEKQSQKIDTAIKIKQSQIEKLNEYKTTLINAAVTGKIKVV